MVVCKGELLLGEMEREMCWGCINSRTQMHKTGVGGMGLQTLMCRLFQGLMLLISQSENTDY